MEKIVRITIKTNNVHDKIQIVEGNSCDPSFNPYLLPGHIADMFICELLDSEFFGECTLPTICNIWDRQLCDIASIVLKRAQVWVGLWRISIEDQQSQIVMANTLDSVQI